MYSKVYSKLIPEYDRYRNPGRRMGRSTVIALGVLAKAIQNPGRPVEVWDHAGTARAHEHLAWTIRGMIVKLGLEFIEIKRETRGGVRVYIVQSNHVEPI